MPEVHEAVPVTAVRGVPRTGVHLHVFVAANFFVQGMLNRYRQDRDVVALPEELTAASERTVAFLQSESARVSIRSIGISSGSLQAEVFVQNLSGHKLPTAYPSRRAWLHVVVKDHDGRTVFESGALSLDGSIQGNDNDADPTRFEPHYREITSSDQVEIYEPILKDSAGRVTTGLLSAAGYLKDNRLLPSGFRKDTAEKDTFPPRLGIPPTPWDSHFPITPAAEGRLTETGISRATKSGCFNLLQTWTVRDTRLRGARMPEFRETPLFIPWRVGGRP